MNHRSTTFALFLALLVSGIVAFTWLGSGGRGRATDALSGIETSEGRAPTPLEGAPEAPRADRNVAALPELAELAPATAPARARAATDIVLSGVAVRLAADGTEFSTDDGRFRLVQRLGAGIVESQVDVLEGRWTASVAPSASLYFSRVVLGGVPVSLEPDDFAVPKERFLTLRGRERVPVRLHVLSDATGKPLDGVEVWLADSGTSQARHPGAEPVGEPLVRGPSPVEVPPDPSAWRANARVWVRAPGYAFGAADLDHQVGGERTLRLPGACSLEVELLGSAPWLEPEVRLWPPEATYLTVHADAARSPDSEGRAVFAALEPGVYTVAVERGRGHDRQSFGSARVELTAGDHLRVPIHVTLPEVPIPVKLTGTLTLPSAWERAGLELVVSGAEDNTTWMDNPISHAVPELAALDAERLAFAFELPTDGAYLLEVEPLLVRSIVRVPAEGLSDFELVVPVPADVEVKVVDAATGDELFPEKLYWTIEYTEGSTGTWLYPAYPDSESGRIAFRAPAGEVMLAAEGRSLEAVDEEAQYALVPGPNTLTWSVHRQLGVHITFLDGDAALPWDWQWRIQARQLGGGARHTGSSVGMLWFREPGTYELTSDTIPGYESIDGTRFDVLPTEQEQRVEVELVRLP